MASDRAMTGLAEVGQSPLTVQERHGWLAVGILLTAYAVSYVDRQVISLLVEPLKADLSISDTQIGILQGPAFGIFYAVLGLPIGWLADRVDRVRLISGAIVLWSLMTLASGLADSFVELLLARIGVGIGEAALVPAAVSLLSDLFVPKRRALPLSIFTSGVSLGLGLALVAGGYFVAIAHAGTIGDLPIIGSWLASQESWQAVFVLAGLLGFPVAMLVGLLDEPRRSGRTRLPEVSVAHSNPLSYIAANRSFFVPMYAATGCLYVVSNAVSAWLPTLFIRKFEWTPLQVGEQLGAFVMLSALTGNVLSGVITQALWRRGTPDAPLRTMMIGVCLIVPTTMIAPLLSMERAVLGGMLVHYLGVALTFGIATTAFVSTTPSPYRGRAIALYLLIGNLFGMSIGPPSIGWTIDHGPSELRQVGPALVLVAGTFSVLGAILLWRARRAYPHVVGPD